MVEGSGIDVESNDEGGARVVPKYHTSTHDIVGVPVIDIKDAAGSDVEEFLQFSVGGFFASGAFWLGIERLVTVGYKDPLFYICVIALIFGAVLAFAGFRQTRRRINRLARYIPNDDLA